jgi:DNA-binding NarL/FixJ family response regulator
MSIKGPILILEDDEDDEHIFTAAFKNIGVANELKFFTNGEAFLHYLYHTSDKPFILISSFNLKRMSGLEVRRQMQADDFLRSKGIPFIFFTLRDDPEDVQKAYDLTVQGYFVKQDRIEDMEKQIRLIVDYWMNCRHTNS